LVLQGIYFHPNLAKTLIFKGGTVLKKAYFDNYRFSEDLDFSLLDNMLEKQKIMHALNEIFNYIKEEANIPLSIYENNDHEDGGINFYISYTGPLGGQSGNKRVKVDISRNEKLVFEPIQKTSIDLYSDQTKHSYLCYSLEEILVEKLRSIMQRMQARDFYDIWYLLEIQGLDACYYINAFIEKTAYKNLNPSDFSKILQHRLPQYKARWQQSMKDQIKELPEFKQVERETMRKLRTFKV
jgi:uncharacterized protein